MLLCKFLPLVAFGCRWLREPHPTAVQVVKITTITAPEHVLRPVETVTETVTKSIGILATAVTHTFSVPPSAQPAMARPVLRPGNFVSVVSNGLSSPGDAIATGIMSLAQWFGYAAAKQIVHIPEYHFEYLSPDHEINFASPGLNLDATSLSAALFAICFLVYMSYFVPYRVWQRLPSFVARIKVASLIKGGLLIGVVLMVKNRLPCSLVSILTVGSDPVTIFKGEMRHVILFFIFECIFDRMTVARPKQRKAHAVARESTRRSCHCHKLKPSFKAVWDRMVPGLEAAGLRLVTGIGFCFDQAPSVVDVILDGLAAIVQSRWKYIMLPIGRWCYILLRHIIGRSCYVPIAHGYEDDPVYRSAWLEAPTMSHHDVAVWMAKCKQYELDKAQLMGDAMAKANALVEEQVQKMARRYDAMRLSCRTLIVMVNNARELAGRLTNIHIKNARGRFASEEENKCLLANWQMEDVAYYQKPTKPGMPYAVASTMSYIDLAEDGLHFKVNWGSRPPQHKYRDKQMYWADVLTLNDRNEKKLQKGLQLDPRHDPILPPDRIGPLNIFEKDAWALNTHYMAEIRTVGNFNMYTADMHSIKESIDDQLRVGISGHEIEDHLLKSGTITEWSTPVKPQPLYPKGRVRNTPDRFIRPYYDQ